MKLKLSHKLGAGFGAVLFITLGLGSIALWQMRGEAEDARVLAEQKVRQTEISANLETNVASMMLAARTYGYTGQVDAYNEAVEAAKRVNAELERGSQLAEKFPNLVLLRENMPKARELQSKYEGFMEQSRQVDERMTELRATMDKAAGESIAELARLQKTYNEKLKHEIDSKVPAADLHERALKIELLGQVRNAINRIRIVNMRAQMLRDPSLLNQAEPEFASSLEMLGSLKSIISDPADLAQLRTIEEDVMKYRQGVTSVRNEMNLEGQIAAGRAEVGNAITALAAQLVEKGLKDTVDGTTDTAESLTSSSNMVLVGVVVAMIVGITLAIVLTRSITGPIGRIIEALTAGAEQTSAASTQVSAASQSLAQGASENAAALEETSSSLEEMSSMTRKNAETAQQAAALSAESKANADRGNASMQKMSAAINEIQKSATETAKILKVIDEIAFQTNLLALNAAVEAARAGEAGKGFAVVAEEVRNLAMRSAEAAKNTSALLEESVKSATNGVTVAEEVGSALAEITTSATKVSALVGEIAAASQEQAQGIGQVNTAVQQMDKVTQSNAANAEESASAAEELSSQAVELTAIVNELSALINGASARGEAMVSAMAHASKKHPQAPAGGAVKRHKPAAEPAPAKGKKPSAEAVIPFDDDGKDGDFSAFNKAA